MIRGVSRPGPRPRRAPWASSLSVSDRSYRDMISLGGTVHCSPPLQFLQAQCVEAERLDPDI